MSSSEGGNAGQRTDWFRDARFGLFVHWGLYALLGRAEWAMSRECIPPGEYAELAERFDASGYRPREWAAMARDAGMRYAVLTAKHHEGFCLWESKACCFHAGNSAAKRDLFGEYVEAFRDAGLKVGVYYSLGDWMNPDWRLGFSGGPGADAARERFVGWTHAMVEELMTGYGTLDLLFYDLPQNYSAWQWRMVELNARVRARQPGILINNRGMTTEDYATPEQHAVASPPGRLWETCMTLNDNWGYVPTDRNFKDPRQVVLTLAQIAEGGGNLLLNVGPDGAGRIPEESSRILRGVGRWLRAHGEAVYGSERHGMSWNLFGPCTVKGNDLYLHLFRWFGPEQAVGGLTGRVIDAVCLSDGRPLEVEQQGDRAVIRGLPEDPPDPLMPVVRLTLDRPPAQDFTDQLGTADVFPVFPA